MFTKWHLKICLWLWMVCLPLMACAGQTNLASCAQRYGYIMADHWMVVDLVQQIERARFYAKGRDLPGDQEFAELREAVSRAGEGLEEARGLYHKLYHTNSADAVIALDELLSRIAKAESENEKAAENMLQKTGERLGRGSFRPVVLRKEEIEPAWDFQKFIGKDHRPTRLLFGSTAGPGDDRALPLRFDFGKGIFGFFAPMEGPGKLAMSEGVKSHSDGSYLWMKEHHTGYHYWAGVYNNQNTYVAPWFLKLHKEDPDVWLKLADGKLLSSSGGEWGQVNIWNTHVQDYLRDYCEAQARALKDDPRLLCYDYTAEPHPWASQPPKPAGLPQYSGYNQSAITAFQDSLEKKFGAIGKLNKAWKTDYASFRDIRPPSDPYVSLPPKATPLSYEFERFRCDSHTRFWKLAHDSYRQFDPAKPIVANAGMYLSGWPVEALDSWQLQKAGVADWIDMHMNNFWPNLPEQIYLYSLCRLSGKVPVQFEYVWSFPRTGPLDDTSESDFRAICQASIWRNLVWGKKVFVFFDLAYDWPAYHNAFLDRDLGYSILRPSICVVPAMKRKALRFNDLFMSTEVVSPPIIILQPSASVLNSPPIHPNQGFSYHTSVAGNQAHKLLFPKNYPFLYVPEEAVLEEGYRLDKHQVIILPQAPYLPAEMSRRLLDWVKRGGTLISLGVPGIWNPYGQADLNLINQVFGQSEVADQKPGQWQWSWNPLKPRPGAQWVRDESGNVICGQAKFGRGSVLVSTGGYERKELMDLFYRTLDGAIKRPAYCAQDQFELVLRQDSRGGRYLFILNPHTREVREDEIILTGNFPACTDLGIGSGVPVPASVNKGETRFRARLFPGEGAVIALKPQFGI